MSISDKGEFILQENNKQDNDKNKFTSSSSTYSYLCSFQRLRGINSICIICTLCLLYFLTVSILFYMDSMEQIEYESAHSMMKGIINNNYKTPHLQMLGSGQALFDTKWNPFITILKKSDIASEGRRGAIGPKGNSFILKRDTDNPAMATFQLYFDDEPSTFTQPFKVDFSKEPPSEIIKGDLSKSFSFPIVENTDYYAQIYVMNSAKNERRKQLQKFHKLFCKEFKKHQPKPTQSKKAKGDGAKVGKDVRQKVSDWKEHRKEKRAQKREAVAVTHQNGFQNFDISLSDIADSSSSDSGENDDDSDDSDDEEQEDDTDDDSDDGSEEQQDEEEVEK